MNTSLVSVIIPVYNAEKYITTCLTSVIEQTIFEKIQVICVNDCSSDNSRNILNAYESTYENIIVLDLPENKGLAIARNKGAEIATGEYIYFLDADDYIEKNAIECLYETAKNNHADIVTFESSSFYEDEALDYTMNCDARRNNKYPKSRNSVDLFIEMFKSDDFFTMSWLYFIKREYIEKNNLKYLECRMHEDVYHAFMLHFLGGTEVVVDAVLHHYRRHENSITYDKDMIKHLVGYIKTYKAMLELALYTHMDHKKYDAYRMQINSIISVIIFYTLKSDYEDIMEMRTNLEKDLLAIYEDIIYRRKLCVLPEIYRKKIMQKPHIYIYGAGVMAIKTRERLLDLGINVDGFVVTSIEENEKRLFGLQVMDIDSFNINDDTAVIVIGVSDKYKMEIVSKIQEKQLCFWDLEDYVL